MGNIESTSVSLGQKFALLAEPCHRYDLELNYSAVKIEWEGKGTPVEQILVTDVELSSSVCDANSFNYCSHQAKTCLSNLITGSGTIVMNLREKPGGGRG